jgi:cell division protein FtsB
MRSDPRITRKKIGSTGFLLFILYAIWIQHASAQSPNDQKREIEQLKDKLEQLDQMMKEIRGEISALENQRQDPAVPPSAVPPTAALATAVAHGRGGRCWP